jgi:hypothetical protein
VVNAVYDVPVDSIASDPRSRFLLARLAIAAFGAPTDTSASYSEQIAPTHAAELMVALRDPSVIPALITALDSRRYFRAMATLIQLTGVIDQSASLSGTPEVRLAAQRFWISWWREHAREFVPVSRAAGDAALRQWIQQSIAH